jgi:hypothetical protein
LTVDFPIRFGICLTVFIFLLDLGSV